MPTVTDKYQANLARCRELLRGITDFETLSRFSKVLDELEERRSHERLLTSAFARLSREVKKLCEEEKRLAAALLRKGPD